MLVKNNPKIQLLKQLNSFYEINETDISDIDIYFENAIQSLENCYRFVNNKYYHDGNNVVFNALHVGQWSMFLYLMSRESSCNGNIDLADKLYGLCKIISSADIFYGVEMPDIWFFDHPQGSVLGRASYSDYFTFSQGCTVGNNKGKFPVFDRHVSMLSNSKVLGDCNIGNHVIFAANSYCIDTDIPSYSIVFGSSPNLIIKPISAEKFHELTGSMFDGNA